MEWPITLEPATLIAIENRLKPLARTVLYDKGKLVVTDFDPANEPRIVDEIVDCLPTVRDMPRWSDIAPARHRPLAVVRTKRRRQAA